MRETQGTVNIHSHNNTQTDDHDRFLCQREQAQLEMLGALERVRSKIALGPAPSFNEAHVVKALEIIDRYGTVGRIGLSNRLELGIGTTRTILRHLKKEGLIASSRYGFAFTEEGKQLFLSIRSSFSAGVDVQSTSLTVGPVVVAVLVRDMAHKIGRGVEQRNTAIRAGALGATTFIFSRNQLVMPSKKNHSITGISELQTAIVSKLKPKENDVIIFGSGENRANAEIGAIMAALKLLKAETEK